MSALLIVGQTFLTDANPIILWSNWVVAGGFALILWNILGRFHLGGVSDGKALAITWPLMSVTLNFSYLYFAPDYPFYQGILQLFALMSMITLMLSIWQEESATLRNLSIGLFIGFCSTFFPHTILWLFMVPVALFHMRSTSSRNGFNVLTGAILGVWIDYFLLFVIQGPDTADRLFLQFVDIIDMADYAYALSTISLWQWLYLAMLALLVIVYSISAMLLGTGHSVRSSASIMLLSTMSIAQVFFLCFDLGHTALYICQLALFLGIQLSIHQANIRSSANEWWTIFILLLGFAISVLPLL